jgi:hypothetical protein
MKKLMYLLSAALVLAACQSSGIKENAYMDKVEQFAGFTLTADVSALSDNEKEMLRLLFQVSDIMDGIFWQEAYGDPSTLLDTIKDQSLKKFVLINYGPWERLNGNLSFIKSIGEKPAGANFYPADMTKAEFEAWENPEKSNQYTMVRRDESGKLQLIPYHQYFSDEVKKAAGLLKQASELSEDDGLKKYLSLRSEALLTDDYQLSDLAWMDMKTNRIDFVVGPIENYEDQLFGIRTAHEAYILIKDMEWSEKLNLYSALLPELQKNLPVSEDYKAESPGTSSDLAVYDVIYYAGDCNSGSKTIAINLPNDEEVQLQKGSRRLQLKNAMQAKFDKILVPIAGELITEEQQKHISFNAFFGNTMFHEVAHGLGIKNTISGKGTVREAMKEQYSTLEEGKADILGLFLVTRLNDMGVTELDLMDNYTTFLAGIFRSIRFGSTSAHGKANLVRFNYFKEKEAFTRNTEGRYSVNFEKMQEAVDQLSAEIIVIQGNGDYEAAQKMVEKYGVLSGELENDLNLINSKNIPVDIVFDQGPEKSGL